MVRQQIAIKPGPIDQVLLFIIMRHEGDLFIVVHSNFVIDHGNCLSHRIMTRFYQFFMATSPLGCSYQPIPFWLVKKSELSVIKWIIIASTITDSDGEHPGQLKFYNNSASHSAGCYQVAHPAWPGEPSSLNIEYESVSTL
jgi:hypothetical protein